MGLAVLNPGLSATVQDLGRPGYAAWGVPSAGAFDRGAAALANALLGNPPDCAVIELTLSGGVFEALSSLALALAGAPMAARTQGLDGRTTPLAVPGSFPLGAGERLFLGGAAAGVRTYLAVRGGWQTPVVLGSRSSETPLREGEVVPCDPGWTPARRPAPGTVSPPEDGPCVLRVVAGPDLDARAFDGLNAGSVFRVGARSDRMGLRLEGPTWEVAADPDRVSAPVVPGAVQVAGGLPLILGVACGTTGGYPHVAHVASADHDRLAQARPGGRLRFERVSLDEARALDRRARRERARLSARVAAAASDGGLGTVG